MNIRDIIKLNGELGTLHSELEKFKSQKAIGILYSPHPELELRDCLSELRTEGLSEHLAKEAEKFITERMQVIERKIETINTLLGSIEDV